MVAQKAPLILPLRTSLSICRVSKISLAMSAKRRVKFVEGLQDDLCSLVVVIFFVRFFNRGVDIIAAQFFHTQAFGFEPEKALEVVRILAGDLQKGLDDRVGDIVDQVAHRDGLFETAQVEVFIAPIAHDGLVDLPQDGGVFLIDLKQGLVGTLDAGRGQIP
jgi:hypothetical protein